MRDLRFAALITCLLLSVDVGGVHAQTETAETADSPGETADVVPRKRARNVDLDAPVVDNGSADIEVQLTRSVDSASRNMLETNKQALAEKPDISQMPDTPGEPIVLLDTEVSAGTAARLAWDTGAFEAVSAPTPILVVNGVNPGPTLCLTAAVHGDELNGIEIVRRVMYGLDPKRLTGAVVGVPIVNLIGFKRSSRYLPDRRDLNRHFPGNPEGSLASRIAHSFFNEVIRHCDVLVDLHTGSFYRTNLPQLRADLRNGEVVKIAESFGSHTAIVHSPGADGTLRRAATEAGIPTVTLEAGEPMRLQSDEVTEGTRGINTLLNELGMYRGLRVWGNPAPVHYESRWVRADAGGILFGAVKLGANVERGQLLGTVTDPITNVRVEIRSPFEGTVIGMAVDQVVLPGFAAFHIGIRTSADNLYEPMVPGNAIPTNNNPENPPPDDYDPDGRDTIENS